MNYKLVNFKVKFLTKLETRSSYSYFDYTLTFELWKILDRFSQVCLRHHPLIFAPLYFAPFYSAPWFFEQRPEVFEELTITSFRPWLILFCVFPHGATGSRVTPPWAVSRSYIHNWKQLIQLSSLGQLFVTWTMSVSG